MEGGSPHSVEATVHLVVHRRGATQLNGAFKLRSLKCCVVLLTVGTVISTSYIALGLLPPGRPKNWYDGNVGLHDVDENAVIEEKRHELTTPFQSRSDAGITNHRKNITKKYKDGSRSQVRSLMRRHHLALRPGEQTHSKPRAISRQQSQLRYQDQWDYLKVNTSANKPLVYSRSETEAVQAERQRHLEQVCRDVLHIPALNLHTRPLLDPATFKWLLGNTYINDDYNLTVTIIRKVGSSNWRRFMTDLFRISSKGFQRNWEALKPLRKRPSSDITHQLQRNTKVLFVRNPLLRLLSGFRDKYVKLPTNWNIKTANKIILHLRGRKAPKPAVPDLTFTEFLRYLLEEKSGLIGDEHFSPIFQLSQPCQVRYDFIGKLETLPSDTAYLIDKLGVGGRVEYGYPKPYSGSANTTRLVEYFSQVPPKLIKEICKVYQEDFLAFDYPIPSDFSDLQSYMERIA
ncbi:carbohydrate sulfotransferase 14-like [Acanthaster planci]|uniref:Carbohydrate sulfotransferase n=1 Tax=Acanthaster planci TaxID=133434 RepID=A0A8B7YT69_ACAPL|nr:carbohydrate sulfotransferase 14-like [Acanthaster planci]